MYVANKTAYRYMKHKLIELKEVNKSYLKILIALSVIDRARHKNQ